MFKKRHKPQSEIPESPPMPKINWNEILKDPNPTWRLKQCLIFYFIGHYYTHYAKEEDYNMLLNVFELIEKHENLFK